MYGFETVESCINGLFQFSRQLHKQLPAEIPNTSEAKPSVLYVTTIEQATTLAQESTQNDADLVAIEPNLLAKLQRKPDILKPNNSISPVGWSSYAITTITELRRLLDHPPNEN